MDRTEHLTIWATFFAGHGLPTFPLFGVSNGVCRCPEGETCPNPGKHPKVKGWRDLAKPILPGPLDNLGVSTDLLVVVDFDAGDSTPDFPDTFRVKTQRGVHLWYLADPERPIKSQTHWRPKVDIRAKGGLVVAPPSRTVSGTEYTYVGGEGFALVPSFITNTARAYVHRDKRDPVETLPSDTAPQVRPLIDRLVEQIEQAQSGERNSTFFAALCRFFELATGNWAGEDALADLCQAALRCGLGLEEVKRTVESASRSLTY